MTQNGQKQPTQCTAATLIAMIEQLEFIANDRSVLALLDDEQRKRFSKAINQAAFPNRKDRKKLLRAFRSQEKAELESLKKQDDEALALTGMRSPLAVRQLKKSCAPTPFEPSAFPEMEQDSSHFRARLNVARNCYICKEMYEDVHFFYDSLCPNCATLNWERRNQSADLSGRFAVVTGGRVKIGFQAGLKLLRAGAHVVVTTRFARDAALRFQKEKDFRDWSDRLEIFGIDLRHSPSIEAFADHLCQRLPRLDFLLNNACQTVRRPPGFYAHLMQNERQLAKQLPEEVLPLLDSYEQLRSTSDPKPMQALPAEVSSFLAGLEQSAELSQIPLAPEDHGEKKEWFPENRYDEDAQQVDLRSINSWRLKLAEVSTVELMEVHLVNSIAPFILNARLKPLFLRVPTPDKHIVNVSAMEGIFYRAYKTDKHPHTNMAKAALNMMTRTSAQDYARDGIHMNSVDTGWITDEDPADIAKRKSEETGFKTPLDQVDAAARICDPIFQGFLSGTHVWGKFLKDYRVANW